MISFWDGDSVFEEEFLPAVSNAVVWLLQRNMEDFTEDLESPQATLDLALWMILKRWPEGPFGEQISTRLLLRHGGSWPDEAQLEAFVDNRMTILSGISDMQCFQNAKSPSSAARIALSACFRRGMNDEFRSIVLSSFSSSQILTTNSAPSLVAQSILSGHWEDASDPAERIRTTTLVLSALMASNSLSRTELLCLLVLSLNVGSSPTAIPTPPAAAGMEDTPATPDNRIQFDPVDDDVINQLQLAGFDEEDICLVSTIGPHSSHGEMHCASNVVRSRRNPTP